MFLLVLGILIWSVVHLIPSAGTGVKAKLVGQIGQGGYKGVFSILILVSIALIVLGWRSSTPSHLYLLPPFASTLAMVMLLVAFLLLVAASMPTRVKRMVRHPQLTGVAVWAAAHLLVNGDSRSVILFGGLGLWAVLEIILINKREGRWTKSPVPGWGQEVAYAVVSAAIFALVLFLHPYFAGVSVVP